MSLIVLHSRRGCHLCEQAEDMLAALMPGAEIRDVDADVATRIRYGDRVPVLEVDGTVVMEGRFDERALAAWLAARATGRG
jgi:glutaredoxin